MFERFTDRARRVVVLAQDDARMLKDLGMGLELLPAAKALLAERGYDPVLGARPLRRTIQRAIEDALSEKILFGEPRPGQIVTVDVEDTGPKARFTFEGVPTPGEAPDTPPAEIASGSKAAHVAGSPLNGSPKRVSGGRYPSS